MRKGPEVVASAAEPVEAGQPAEPEPT
jgi:hypothetical protein